MAEWQSSAGVLFDQLSRQSPPTWTTTLGLTSARLAEYAGASSDREWTGPLVDVRYRDRWFASTEEGLGVNLPSPPTMRTGAALTYDFGRPAARGPNHALPGIHAAPELKLFAEEAFTPALVRFDVRRAIGGYDGWVADLSLYAALPLSQSLVLFAGPSVTVADGNYLQRYFGVDAAAASAGSGPLYRPHAGLESAALGATLVWSIDDHWGLEGYGACDRLLGSAADSPVRGSLSHPGGGFALGYQF
ncbi:MAG: MipA/OmpV family protein [Nevskia sp.]|nr:MipA/OmpV family protein [Nevskia sp.]